MLTCDRDEDALHPELAHLHRVLAALPPRVPAVAVVLSSDIPEARIRSRSPGLLLVTEVVGGVVANFVVVLQNNRNFNQQ